ncbi:hypothetical protein GCM10009530_40950 [Microbispora corallina]|uniref:Uncharacterized protein n=1 Tax=Microbispora corallina TaxID=83302 RepID=A0ABQ4GA00_9ACTN|nr:hypothetical protein Mco01_68870 [Microbispora corallina]
MAGTEPSAAQAGERLWCQVPGPPALMLGCSLGAWIGLHLALSHPEQVRSRRSSAASRGTPDPSGPQGLHGRTRGCASQERMRTSAQPHIPATRSSRTIWSTLLVWYSFC